VRKEFYRTDEDLAEHYKNDPIPKQRKLVLENGFAEDELKKIESEIEKDIADQSHHGSRMQPDAANDRYRQTGSDNLVLRRNRLG